MAIDQAIVGKLAAELMEQLEEAYGEEATITAACLIVAVDQGGQSTVHSKFSPGMAQHEGLGLLEYTLRSRWGGRVEGG